MELNGRAWGSMALARRRGFEYPAWNVQAALDPDFVPVEPTDPPEILARHLGMELAHLAFVARGPQSKALDYLAEAVADDSSDDSHLAPGPPLQLAPLRARRPGRGHLELPPVLRARAC